MRDLIKALSVMHVDRMVTLPDIVWRIEGKIRKLCVLHLGKWDTKQHRTMGFCDLFKKISSLETYLAMLNGNKDAIHTLPDTDADIK